MHSIGCVTAVLMAKCSSNIYLQPGCWEVYFCLSKGSRVGHLRGPLLKTKQQTELFYCVHVNNHLGTSPGTIGKGNEPVVLKYAQKF